MATPSIIGDSHAYVKTANFSTPLTFSEQTTLEIILNLCRQRGYCFARNATLAEMRQVSVPTITRHIAKFCQSGILRYQRVGNDRRLYFCLNDEGMIRPRLDFDYPQYTKETIGTKGKDSVYVKEKQTDTPMPAAEASVSEEMPIPAPTMPVALANGFEAWARQGR